MPSAEALGAICVQRFDDSRNSAIHTTYRISLRSSSLREPRYPLLRVVIIMMKHHWCIQSFRYIHEGVSLMLEVTPNKGCPLLGGGRLSQQRRRATHSHVACTKV